MKTATEIVKYKTDNDNLLFIGAIENDEEYYQEIGKTGGWSFMGLRPNTEAELRERARDRDIEDFIGKVPPFLDKYIDYDAFADDMEENWKEDHDVQAERENEDGETLYLGFVSGTDAKHYFKEHNINTYEDYCRHFDVVGLSKKEFTKYKKEYVK